MIITISFSKHDVCRVAPMTCYMMSLFGKSAGLNHFRRLVSVMFFISLTFSYSVCSFWIFAYLWSLGFLPSLTTLKCRFAAHRHLLYGLNEWIGFENRWRIPMFEFLVVLHSWIVYVHIILNMLFIIKVIIWGYLRVVFDQPVQHADL